MQLEPQNHGAPKCPDIVINPENWGSITEPQACEKNGNWFYNYPAACKEAEFLGKKIPTIDELMKVLESVPGNAKEKAKALNIPMAGYRSDGNGEFHEAGDYADVWSSSTIGVVSAKTKR